MFEGYIYKFELNMQVSPSRRLHVNIKDDKCKITASEIRALKEHENMGKSLQTCICRWSCF
jgi:hypothetical protein